MTIARKGFSGTAVPSSINGAIGTGATSIVLNTSTGWPDGTNGKSPAKIDPGLPTEEDILFTNRSGSSLTGVIRAQNGTVAASHANGAVIIHGWSAGEADELYQHVSDVEATPHSTKLLSPTAHAGILHAVGSTLPALGTAQDLGNTADGSGATLAGGNHSHGAPAWTPYTPTWTAGGAPSIGNGAIGGSYLKIGKLGWFRFSLSIGSTTNLGSGTWAFSAPPGFASIGFNQIGIVWINSAGWATMGTFIAGATFNIYSPDATPTPTPSMNPIGATYPNPWANGDFLMACWSGEVT